MSSSLVVVSSSFPERIGGGDSVFLMNEIGALADSFDRIILFSYYPVSENVLPLPDNVEYRGHLVPRGREVVREAWAGAVAASRPMLAELGHGPVGMLANMRALLLGAAVYKRMKGTLRELAAEGSVAIYYFWGAGGAYSVPYVRRDFPKSMIAVRFHRVDLYADARPVPLQRAVLSAASLALPVSSHGACYLKDRVSPQARSKILVSRLGTMDAGTGPLPHGSNAKFRVVSVSSLTPVKRVNLIADVLRLVPNRVAVEWEHFGDGPLLQHLEASIDGLPDRHSVKLHGNVSNERLMNVYRTTPIDLFLNVSSSEGVPVSIMEALSFGIPVLATDAGGTGEVVNAESGGFLVPVNIDPQTLSEVMSEALARSGRLRARSRQFWRSHYDAEVNARRLADLLVDAVKTADDHVEGG